MNIGERIRRLRLEKNLKQSDLAKKANISRVTLGNYERGDRTPNTDSAKQIAEALEVPLSELLDDKPVTLFSGFGGAYHLFKEISKLPLIGEEYLKSFDEKTLNYFEKEFEEKKFYYNLKSILNELEFDIDSLSEKEQKEIYKKILEYVQFEIFKLTNSKEK